MEEHFRTKEAFVANVDVNHVAIDGLVHEVLELLGLCPVSLLILDLFVVLFKLFQYVFAHVPILLFNL